MTTISVCIPTYNQSQYLVATIESIMTQTILPDEIIVSNDCSTDNTKEILERLSNKIEILKVIHQPTNLGISKNTNACLRAAKGEYIVRVDSDDLLLPKFIETLSICLDTYPNAGFAHAAVQEIDENGTPLLKRYLYRNEIFQQSDTFLKKSLSGYRVAANIIMFRKTSLEAVGYIGSNINFAEDYFLAVAISNAGFGNVYSKEILSCYRVWTDTEFIRKKRKLEEIMGLCFVFNKAILPAFIKRKWSTREISIAKINVAKRQAVCLGWDIYSSSEKQVLEKAILDMSSDWRVKVWIYLFKNGYGFLLNYYYDFFASVKSKAKKIISNSSI